MGRLVNRLVPQADQNDVIQEALIRAWLKRHQFDPRRGSLSTWLLAITADQARRSRRNSSRSLIGASRANVHSIDDRIDLEHAIAELPDRQRLAVDCHYFAGLSIAETAAVMRCSSGTVKSSLWDARLRLRKTLGDRDG
jgi:RNA polymerase sigma factor (sigma-70 family)